MSVVPVVGRSALACVLVGRKSSESIVVLDPLFPLFVVLAAVVLDVGMFVVFISLEKRARSIPDDGFSKIILEASVVSDVVGAYGIPPAAVIGHNEKHSFPSM